jgi:hypothetical protein
MVFGNRENIKHHEEKIKTLSQVVPTSSQEANELKWEKGLLESNLKTLKRVEELDQIIDLRKFK